MTELEREIRIDLDYLLQLPQYKKHADFIRGTKARTIRYLRRTLAERSNIVDKKTKQKVGDVAYAERRAHFANRNLTKRVLEIWLGYLNQQISMNKEVSENDAFIELRKNITGFGHKLETFARDFIWEYAGKGRAGILAEGTPKDSDKLLTQQEEKARGDRSFLKLLEAQDILAEERFEDPGPLLGQLRRVLLYNGNMISRDPSGNIVRHMKLKEYILVRKFNENEEPTDEFAYQVNHYHTTEDMDLILDTFGDTPTKELEEKLLISVKFDGSVVVDMPFIPICILGEGIEDSVIEEVVSLNEEHLNKKSKLDQIHRFAAGDKLVFFGVNADEVSDWSDTVHIFFPGNGKVEVIEPSDPTSLQKDLDNIEKMAVETGLLKINQQVDGSSKQVQSVDSKKADNAALEKKLIEKADLVEDALSKAITTMMKFEEGKNSDIEANLEFAQDYNFQQTDEELANDTSTYTYR